MPLMLRFCLAALLGLLADWALAASSNNGYVEVRSDTPGVVDVVPVGMDFHITTTNVPDTFKATVTVSPVSGWDLRSPDPATFQMAVGGRAGYEVRNQSNEEDEASGDIFLFKVDVEIAGVGEDKEETEGAFAVYADCSQGYSDPACVAAMKPVKIRCLPANRPDGERIVRTFPSGHLLEKIGTTYQAAQSSYKANEIGGKSFWLHGHAASGAERDKAVQAEHDVNGCKDAAKYTVVKVDFIEASSTVADNSPQQFQGHKTYFGDPCATNDSGQALVVFHKDVRNKDFVVQDYDVTLKANIMPVCLDADQLSESWAKVVGPSSGGFNRTDTFEVKYKNAKKSGLYQCTFDLGLSGCAKSGVNLHLPLGGPDVTAYYLSEAQRYDTWLSTMKARVNTVTTDDFSAGVLIISYFVKTVSNMNHKFGTYESESSPCKAHCDNTVTISGYVFGKDHIGNFLFSYLAARTGFTFGATELGAQLVATAQGKVDFPDDKAAYEAGYAHGEDPSGDFKTILESKNIDAMQNEAAKKGWPSTETATGSTYPTWGATHGGLDIPD